MLIIANQLFIFPFFQILDVLKVDRVCHAKLPRRRNLCVKDVEQTHPSYFWSPRTGEVQPGQSWADQICKSCFPFWRHTSIGKCEMMKVWNDTTCAKVRSSNLRLDFAWETLMVFLICLCCIQAMPDLEASDTRWSLGLWTHQFNLLLHGMQAGSGEAISKLLSACAFSEEKRVKSEVSGLSELAASIITIV